MTRFLTALALAFIAGQSAAAFGPAGLVFFSLILTVTLAHRHHRRRG